MPVLPFADTVLIGLAMTLSNQSGADVDPVLWSGRLLGSGSPAALSVAAGGFGLEGGEANLNVAGFLPATFGSAACARGQDSVLAVAGARGGRASLALIVQPDSEHFELATEHALPAAVAGRPVPLKQSGQCMFALVLSDGAVAVASPSHLQVFPGVLPSIADLAELPQGTLGVSTAAGVVVVAAGQTLVALDPRSGASERQTLPQGLVAGALASDVDELVFALDVEGRLLAYRPFAGAPRRIAHGGSPAPGGLSAYGDGRNGEFGIIWGTLAGSVLLFDGTELEELAHWDSAISQPLLSVDLLDSGSLQIVAGLDDGQLGLIERRGDGTFRAERFAIATRASTPPVVRFRSDTSPAELVIGNGARARSFSLGQVTAAPILRHGVSAAAGGQIHGQVSGAPVTGIHLSTRAPGGEDAESLAVTPTSPVFDPADASPRPRQVESSSRAEREDSPPSVGACSGTSIHGSSSLGWTGMLILGMCLWLRKTT